MPNFDGTGPTGEGKMTGRKMGSCNPTASRVYGRGRGGRMGKWFGRSFEPADSKNED